MKPEIILVIVFGRIKFCEGRDLCHDGLIIRAALIQFLFVLFRLFLLPGIMIKNSASVLCSFVISLPVKGGWIMGFPKNFQEFIKADLFGIINDLQPAAVRGQELVRRSPVAIKIDGNQFGSGFVAVNPNSKIPALVMMVCCVDDELQEAIVKMLNNIVDNIVIFILFLYQYT